MATNEIQVGLSNSARSSSRVLKPPGGGHSNIFAEPEVNVNAPRPKYNQQNSSNLNACMGSTDANKIVEKLREEITHSSKPNSAEGKTEGAGGNSRAKANGGSSNGDAEQSSRGRVPPGGFSSGGFW